MSRGHALQRRYGRAQCGFVVQGHARGPEGDCFADAVKAAETLGPDAKIVHGTVILRSGRRGDHCWIERGTEVIDPSASYTGSKRFYYKAVVARPEAMYSVEDALVHGVRERHWGPWHK